jgi:hypothetical protein
MSSIQWDDSSDRQYRIEVSRIQDEFSTHVNTMRNRVPAVVLGIQDANNAVANAKSGIENCVSMIQTRYNELKKTLETMLYENVKSATRIQTLESEVNKNKKVVKEVETLAALRKEQASELQRKGEGNYHSSWMGLWRPLSDQSRLGLIIATVFFGLIALILFGMYTKLFLFPAAIAAYTGNSRQNMNFQIGSSRQKI